MILVDTSAFYSLIHAEDQNHEQVREAFDGVTEPLLTTSYVISETMGLLQRRLGWNSVHTFVTDLLPHVQAVWIGAAQHNAGWELMRSHPVRHLTIVDATAMAVMRERGLRRCLTLDGEFGRQGFKMLPC